VLTYSTASPCSNPGLRSNRAARSAPVADRSCIVRRRGLTVSRPYFIGDLEGVHGTDIIPCRASQDKTSTVGSRYS
jgi:hypothetical protein